MKKIFTSVALALAAFATNANAQINQTTYWNFDQFATAGEDVAAGENPTNYGGLYIARHADGKNATSLAVKKDFTFGGKKYSVNSGLTLAGNSGKPAADRKADQISTDAVAFDAGCAGTIYVQAEGSAADRGIIIYFNAAEANTTKSQAKGEMFTATAQNTEAGTYYIKSTSGSCKIYAVKFVPESDNSTRTFTMSSYGINTFSDTHAWKVPEGMEAYIASATKADKTTGEVTLGLTQVQVIPACTGAILRGEANKEYTMEASDCGSLYKDEEQTKPMVDVNYSFRPVIADYTLEETVLSTEKTAYNNYLLGEADGKLAFGPAKAGVLSTGKAYYRTRGDQDKLASSTSGSKVIALDFGSTTGINAINAAMDKANGQMYNIAGQKVSASYKGMVIVNGKKFINK